MEERVTRIEKDFSNIQLDVREFRMDTKADVKKLANRMDATNDRVDELGKDIARLHGMGKVILPALAFLVGLLAVAGWLGIAKAVGRL